MKKISLFLIALSVSLFSMSSASANSFVGVLDDVSNGGVDLVPTILDTPLGGILYFMVAMLVITTVLGVFLGIFSYFNNKK